MIADNPDRVRDDERAGAFWMFAVSLALLAGLWFFIIADAIAQARRMQSGSAHHSTGGRFAPEPSCSPGSCSRALRLCPALPRLRPAAVAECADAQHGTDARERRVSLADSTYYRTRKPSRGEVVVYVHPKERACTASRLSSHRGRPNRHQGGRAS